ncbi:hypothetical protein C817_01344 [Dorea sp. 5-2]|nr:hypothetical protein C817_01344 [Dorea sp. 5-2]
MKRVGILTLYYKTYNFGAQLQAYALQKAIQMKGYECEQIRFIWSIEQTRFNYDTASVDQEAFEIFAQQIPHSRKIYTPENLDEANEEYDIFVCGSDQIWGIRESMPVYVLPQMLLSFVQKNKKKIVYGASFGSADIAENRKEILKCFFNQLDFISMREQSAVPVVESMTEKQVASVVDPVMLLSEKEWSDVAKNGKMVCPKEPYVLLYNVSCNGELYRTAAEFTKRERIKLINLAYTEGIAIGPCEFISLIEHAEYVITDSFHGSVLSVIFHKRFVTFGVDYINTSFSKNARAKDMLKICGLEEKFSYGKGEKWLEIMKMAVDYEAVDRKVSAAAESSIEYLEKALFTSNVEENKYKASQLLQEKVVNTGNCTGCTACTRCGISCIRMGQDELGFYQPVFYHEKCINCGQCLKLCPVYSIKEDVGEKQSSVTAFALQAKDETLLERSSSGGAFAVIADYFLDNGGIVCGAIYDSESGFEVIHKCGNKKRDLNIFQKSKYVQSKLDYIFSEIEQYLKDGKKVLFTGTPCQAAGLKSYLQKDYERLYTLDLICGGVTAPLLWRKYVDFYRENFGTNVFDMRFKGLGFFRDNGKLAFSISHKRQGRECFYEKEEDLFLSTRMAFYNKSCYQCNFKGNCHEADLTIGDFVGFNMIAPEKDDNKGMSLVLIRNVKGERLLEECKSNIISYRCSYSDALAYNTMIENNMGKPVGIDYLRGIAPVSSIEKLYYETKQIRLFQEKETIFKNFLIEIKRNELLTKIKKYTDLHCKVEYDPIIEGEIVIYGAGKVGRALIDCIDKGLQCFLDQSDKIKSVSGYPVFRPDSPEFKKMNDEIRFTVLVTPIWDYWEIREELVNVYPQLNVVSVEKLVEKIWE